MIQTESDSKCDLTNQAEHPHGCFGNVAHALSFGIFGNQKTRTDRPVDDQYKMKPKDVNIGAPNDYKAEEEFQEETFERVNGNHYKLVKVKKTEEQKKKEQEEAQEKVR